MAGSARALEAMARMSEVSRCIFEELQVFLRCIRAFVGMR